MSDHTYPADLHAAGYRFYRRAYGAVQLGYVATYAGTELGLYAHLRDAFRDARRHAEEHGIELGGGGQ